MILENRGPGLTFDTFPLTFRPFHRPAHGSVTYAKIFTHLGKRGKGDATLWNKNKG